MTDGILEKLMRCRTAPFPPLGIPFSPCLNFQNSAGRWRRDTLEKRTGAEPEHEAATLIRAPPDTQNPSRSARPRGPPNSGDSPEGNGKSHQDLSPPAQADRK